MVSKEVMGRFSFMKEVTVGEKLMVNGVLDYISVPNVKGNLLVISFERSFESMTLIRQM